MKWQKIKSLNSRNLDYAIYVNDSVIVLTPAPNEMGNYGKYIVSSVSDNYNIFDNRPRLIGRAKRYVESKLKSEVLQ